MRRVSGGAGVKRTTCRVAAHAFSLLGHLRVFREKTSGRDFLGAGDPTGSFVTKTRLKHINYLILASSAASFLSSRSTALSTLSTLSPPAFAPFESSMNVRFIALNAPAGSDGSVGFAEPSLATESANRKMSSFLLTTASSATETCGSISASSTPPLGLTLIPFSM